MSEFLTIGISISNTRFDFYPKWVLGTNLNLEIVLLSAELANEHLIEKCNALVLTGGTDLHPFSYQSKRIEYPHAPKDGWDEPRDHFEQSLFSQAMLHKIPVLAICRGMQLVNVTLGGTLIADLEERGKDNHRRMENADRVHSIQIESGTVLFELAGVNQAIINSAHHQAVDRVAEDLIISAVSSSDLVVEALEWKNPAIHAPLLAVQWHPERTTSDADGLSQSIRNWLLESARQHHGNKGLQKTK